MTLQATAGPVLPNQQVLYIVTTIVVVSVVVFTTGVIVALLRRSDRRRAEEEKLSAIGTATARILHQIKNPLQTIILLADILRDEQILSEAVQRREHCEAIVDESQRLSAMLDELSVYASGARRSLNRRPLRLDDVVRQVAGHEAREAGMVVDASGIAEATVFGDVYYLRQVFDNLARNAREAMQGQPDARLWMSVSRADGHAAARVTDNGPGIAPEDLPTIFEPFVSSKGKGMGLGLAICKEIVEGHGGRMEVESTLGQGTTFTVSIPLYVDAPAVTGAGV